MQDYEGIKPSEYDFTATYKAGKGLIFDNRQAFETIVNMIFKDNDKVEIILKKQYATRSIQSNKYYWKVVIDMIALETGDTKDDTHFNMKRLFNSEVTSDGALLIKPTHTMKQDEFTRYVNAVKSWASEELNIYFPETIEDYNLDKLGVNK